MTYQVALLNFEGPLHLLLQLIEQSELEITEIALAEVTEQYLAHIRQLNQIEPAELNQFVELAAKLIFIKSQALLPTPETSEYQDDLQELTHQLEEYRQYQQAGQKLGQLMKQGQPSWSRQAPKPLPNLAAVELPDITAEQLQDAFVQAIARMPKLPEEPIESNFSIEQAHTCIRTAVRSGEASLQSILQAASSRLEAVVLFLSLLELWRAGEIGVRQDAPFGDIILIDG